MFLCFYLYCFTYKSKRWVSSVDTLMWLGEIVKFSWVTVGDLRLS